MCTNGIMNKSGMDPGAGKGEGRNQAMTQDKSSLDRVLNVLKMR